jgi:hypothetical protein
LDLLYINPAIFTSFQIYATPIMNKLLTSTICAGICSLAVASPSQLSKVQLTKLRKIGKVAIPTYIPPRFKLTSVKTDAGEYELDYKGPHGADLLIQMASEGIGDIPLGVNADEKTLKETTRKVTNPTFGTRDMQVDIAKDDREFAVNWIDLGEKAKPKFLSIIGYSMNAELGAKVWKGLRYLN